MSIDKVIGVIEQYKNVLAENSSCTVICAENWIVLNEYGIPCNFKSVPYGNKFRAIQTGHGLAHKVSRWQRTDAEKVAREIGGSLALWSDAVKNHMSELESLIDDIKKMGC